MSIIGRLFKGTLTKIVQENIKMQGSNFIEALMRNVHNQPVYMADNVEAYIKEGYLFNPTVYAVVSFIAQKAGSIPWGVYEVKNEKALSLYKSASPDLSQFKKEAVKTKALVALPNHDLNQLFLKPNEIQAWAEFIEQIVGFKLITGNTYVHCIGPTSGVNGGTIKEMWILPSQRVIIIAGDKIKPIKQYELQGDRSTIIPPEQVIHLKYWTPNSDNGLFLYGVSPIQAGRRVITKSNSSFDASVASYQNMGAYGMITGEKNSGDQSLTEEQAEEIKLRYRREYQGPKNAGKPLITSAALKWQQMGMSPVDLNIIEADKMDLRTICNLYHVPSELFNDAANKTYANTKEAGSAVYTNAVIPALTQFRDSINAFVKNKYPGIFIDFDVSMISELQDDITMMSAALNGCWWLTPNERRDMMSFGIDENNEQLNDYWVPSGLMPMSGANITDAAIDEAAKAMDIKDY